MKELSLTEIGDFFKTDKASDHKFTYFYEEKLKHLREHDVNLFEIGIYHGASLKTWKNYFHNGNIFAIDIENLKKYEEDRVSIEQCDQTDHLKINTIFPNTKFDIIIDDGGHSMFQQQFSLISVFNRLKKGGLYILEDLHTSLSYHYYYNNDLTKKTTLNLMENFENKEESFSGFHVHQDNIKSIYDNIEYCEIYKQNNGNSITCIIKKR